MALTTLKKKTVLVLGVDCAPGRSAAQQLSRAGCRVICASADAHRAEALVEQLLKKGGDPTLLALPPKSQDREDLFRMARDRMGHIHLVVNALALCTWDGENGSMEKACELAREADAELSALLHDHGPTRMLTLWPEEAGPQPPPPPRPDAWHAHAILGPRQRLDTEDVAELDRAGFKMHLRAGAVGDAIVFLLQFPPTVRPTTLRLDCIPSIEKRGSSQ